MAEPIDFIKQGCHIVFDSIAEGVFTVDLDRRITSFNRAAEKITGTPREEAIGKHCLQIFSTNICETDCVILKALKGIHPLFNVPVYMIRQDGKRIPITVNATILKDPKGRMIGAVETFRDLTSTGMMHKSFRANHLFENMVSKNRKMLEIFSTLPLIAESDCTVLIEGATGTGKELLAKAVHNNSSKKNGPFVPVNCGALPDTLIESELFGYKAGAFTDAKTDKPGRFERAQNGTIFLDEISDIPQALQTRLLRVLEDKIIEPLGAVKPVKTNARVVVASNVNLGRMVEEKRFREDLYFRVNVMKLTLPRLTERKEDIPLLVDHFIHRFNNLKKKEILGVTQETMAAMMLYDWPGNVRELENAIECAFVLCKEELIGLQHLPEKILLEINPAIAHRGASLKEIEENAIVQALHRNNWKKMITARELGINKNTLRRKMLAYGIEKKYQR